MRTRCKNYQHSVTVIRLMLEWDTASVSNMCINCPHTQLCEWLSTHYCRMSVLIYRCTERQTGKKQTGREVDPTDRPLSYFPCEHLRVVSLTSSYSTDHIDRRHLGLAAADVSRVYWTRLTKPALQHRITASPQSDSCQWTTQQTHGWRLRTAVVWLTAMQK